MKESDSMRVFIKTRLASPYHAFCICIHKSENNLVSDAKTKDDCKLKLKMQIWKNEINHYLQYLSISSTWNRQPNYTVHLKACTWQIRDRIFLLSKHCSLTSCLTMYLKSITSLAAFPLIVAVLCPSNLVKLSIAPLSSADWVSIVMQ